MYVSNVPRELQGKRTYVPTSKEPGPYEGREDMALWILTANIRDEFMGVPATVSEIYHRITGKMGISISETARLLEAARRKGYLKWGKSQ